MTGKLFVVPTPIGNRRDITLRALEVLEEVDIILCEDTRHSGLLLEYLNIKKPLWSYHEHNEQKRSEEIIGKLKEGKNLALISDAGMPGISDPGAIVVGKALHENMQVEVLPGPSASLTAFVLSGFSGGPFYFHGFLSRKSAERKEEWTWIKQTKVPVILYESPHRIENTLSEIKEMMPTRPLALLRELTKIYQQRQVGSAEEILREGIKKKGEMILVLGPWEEEKEEYDISGMLEKYLQEGMSPSRAVKEVSKKTGVPKNKVYAISLTL